MGARCWALLIAAALLAAACGRSDDRGVIVTVDGSPAPIPASTAEATPTAEAFSQPVPTPTAAAPILDPADLRGFAQPVAGACLPPADRLMPNAPRAYRNGVHEGVDIYDGHACVPVAEDTPVLAMYGGVVVRADLGYADITPEQVNELAARTERQGYSDPDTLDTYRGRQVWIDHGGGVVTRYAHLASIAPGVEVGAAVARGQPIGGVGESGTPESVTAPGTDLHLHYEVRVGDSFLGEGLAAAAVRALYERLFGADPAAGGTDAAGADAVLFRRYETREGDTVGSVAEAHGLAPEYVLWNNAGIAEDGALEAGRALRIPAVAGVIHEVAAGETLDGIARRYGVAVADIAAFAANGLADPDLLRAGATILVPGGRVEAGAADEDGGADGEDGGASDDAGGEDGAADESGGAGGESGEDGSG